MRLTIRAISLSRNANVDQNEVVFLQVNKICRTEDVRVPIICVIDSDNMHEGVSFLGFPVYRNILIVKKKTVDLLIKKDNALDAYLAHEVYHLKRHTFVWKILCLLSDFTLFGNGFLSILHSSYDIEFSADAFAVQWLRQQHLPPYAIIEALKAQEELKEQEYLGELLNNLSFAASIENEEYRRNIIAQCDAANWKNKILINLKLLYQMYFGNYIMSYIHPENEYRIERIREKINESV